MAKMLYRYPRPNKSVYVPTAKYGRRIIMFGDDALYATDDEEEIAALERSEAVRVGRVEEEPDAEKDVQEAEQEVEEEAPPKKVVKRAPKKRTTRKK